MAGFWVFMLSFCMMHAAQARTNFSHSITDPEVHQFDTELCVDIGDSATLQCCIYGIRDINIIIWYKQSNRKQPRIMSRTYTNEQTFFHEFRNPRFKAERSSNCSNMIISNIIQSDEAVYYCSIISPYSVFGNGTYLKIKGTSKPGLCDDSVKCEATLHGNTNFTTQEKAVNASIEDSPEMMQEAEDEMLNYAALKFSKRKAKAENSSTVSPDEYGVQPRRNFDHTIAEPEVHQADTELFVDIGDSATLQCCVYGTDIGVVIWYKQPNRKQPRIMCRTYKTDKETFFHEFQNPRFQAERSSNCSNMIISNIIQSDEAVYYCSIVSPYSVFGNGTYLKIKGKKDTISSGTSKPGLCDDSVHGDCTKNTTQEKAGKNVTILSGSSKPTLSDDSVVCEASVYRNSTNINAIKNTG
ncbi:putative immune-type receptor 14b isoform X1 [Silurus meridionalis]|nr:putative immune-type receptor 14b isoform X1 [Silurus meridionalis]